MKKNFLRLLIPILLLSNIYAHSQKFEWHEPIMAGVTCSATAIDTNGMYYFTGGASNEAGQQLYFHNTPIPYLQDDFLYTYIAKTDEFYNVEWLKVIQAEGYANVSRIKIDSENNLLISCSFIGSAMIGSHYIGSSQNVYSALIAKLNTNGQVIWVATMTSDEYFIHVLDFSIDKSNNVFVSANYWDNVTINSSVISDTSFYCDNYGGIIAKFDTNGEFITACTINCSDELKILGIENDMDQNVIITGWWKGLASFGGQSFSAFHSDIFITKYDSTLNIKWVKQVGTSSNPTILEFGSGVATDRFNNIFVTGTVSGTADFGGLVIDASVGNIFLVSYNPDGILRWIKTAGGLNGFSSNVEKGIEVYVDDEDFVFVLGEFGPTADFDNQTLVAYDDQLNSNKYFDIFVAKYYANGDLSWVSHAGHENYDDVCGSIIKDQSNNLIITGYTRNNAKFGSHILSCDYSYPGFIVSLSDTVEVNRYDIWGIQNNSLDSNFHISVFPNPFSSLINFEYNLPYSQTIIITFYDQLGTQVDLIEKQQVPGFNTLSWRPTDLPDGIYYYKLHSSCSVASGKILLKK